MIRTENITRTYRTDGLEVPALRGISLEVPRGVLAALKGRSGSGKTTLLNLLGGLDRPTKGEVFFDEQPLSRLNDTELTSLRRHRIGFIFQSFALLPTYSAFENVEFMLHLAGLPMRQHTERARRYLHVAGLGKWANHHPARCLADSSNVWRLRVTRARPDLILADEPTGELDTSTTH